MLWAAIVLWPCHGPAAAQTDDDPIAACRAKVSAQPQAYGSYLCFLEASREAPRVAEAARRELQELQRQQPTIGWPLLTLGQLAMFRGDDTAALEFFDVAGQRFLAAGETLGEILVRTNRHLIFNRRGNFAAAAEEVEAARRATIGSEDSEARARALTLAGNHLLLTGGDLVTALAALRQAHDLAFPDGTYSLRYTILFKLAKVAFDLGHHGEALAAYDQLEELLRNAGNTADLALVAFNRTTVRQAQLEQDPEEGGLEELRLRVEGVLEQAARPADQVIAAHSHALLAQIYTATSPPSARNHVAQCFQLADALGLPDLDTACLRARADLEVRLDPAAALSTTTEVLAGSTDDGLRAHGWRARLRAAWAALPQPEALAEGLRALAAIETLRDGQQDAADRARILDNWTADYSWLAGQVLDSEGDPAVAFAIFERLRGRVLLELIHRPDRAVDAEAWAAVEGRAVTLQRRLLDPDLPQEIRSQTLAALERVELEERVLRAAAPTAVGGTQANPVPPRLISLPDVQASLQPREALLTFQVDHRVDLFGAPAGGSWVLAITADAVRVLRLPDQRRLVAATSALRGLVARRDGSEAEVATEFGRQLLGEVVAELPPGIERLILVPDGVLHHLPFAVLRPGADGLPLGLHYELVVAPSATLWHTWRTAATAHQAKSPQGQVSALVLADPTFPHSQGSTAQRGGAWVDGLRLGRLPQARREGRAIRHHLGGELLVGAAASERRLKSETLPHYSVLHFATHAIADLRRPERSCLLLAPGAEDEDGLLRASEIADLRLEGNLVVLSACHTSHGEVLRSEGLMSLARAFFSAGAGSVVGSHWPLADADAADFFDAFYRHLAAGKSAAAALRSARREGYEAGQVAQAWAGPVLLGNGDPPIALHRRAAGPRLATAALAAALAGAVLLLILLFWGRKRV